MKRLCFPICLLLLCAALNGSAQDKTPQPATAQKSAQTAPPSEAQPAGKIDTDKEKDIRRLLEITGTTARMVAVMNEMEKSIRPLMGKSFPDGEYRDKLIEAFFDKFHSKMNPQQLVELAIPVYDKHLSHDEVKGLIRFYETPLGQKTLEALPQMTAELMDQGRKWGEDLGRQSMLEVLAEHPELAKALQDARRNPQP
jgi:uncharacterized protein